MKLAQFGAQGNWIGEPNRVHAKGSRSFYVRLQVIDKNGIRRINRECLEEAVVDLRIGLHEPHFAGQHDSLKPLQKLEPFQRKWKCLDRPVAEGIQRNALSAKLSQDVNRALDRTSKHLLVALEPGVDSVCRGGMSGLQQRATFRETSAGILLLVPGGRADRREKVFHRVFIAREQLAI